MTTVFFDEILRQNLISNERLVKKTLLNRPGFLWMAMFILEWDLRPEFNLGFPELNSGYYLRKVTTRDVFP